MTYDAAMHTVGGLPLRHIFDAYHHSATTTVAAWCVPGKAWDFPWFYADCKDITRVASDMRTHSVQVIA